MECQYHDVHLGARGELHPHPLAEQAQACGRLTKAEGPEGPIAPIVTTGGHSWEKTAFLTRHPCTRGHAHLLCIAQRKKNSNSACHPCARAVRSLFVKKEYTSSRIAFLSLVQGPR